MVYEGSCAISRDLYKWLINFGDWIWVERLNEYFIVEDLMNVKYKRRIDIFVFKDSKKDVSNITGKSDIYLITIKKDKK